MKIALISDYKIEDYKKFGFQQDWSTPKGIYKQLLKTNRVTEVKWYPFPINFDNYPFKEILNDIKNEIFFPDIIFYMSCGPRIDNMFSKATFKNIKLVVDLGDEPQTKGFNTQRSFNADIVLTPDKDCYYFYKEKGYNVIHTGHWADIDLYKPNENQEIKYSVVTSMNGDRGPIPKYLSKKLKNSFKIQNNITPEKNAELYQSGKIVFQKSRFNEISRRLFEGMASNRLVIADRLPYSKDLNLFFKEDEEIILYESKRDALAKINYFLKNKEERNEISENGYKKVIKYFSDKNIINYIL